MHNPIQCKIRSAMGILILFLIMPSLFVPNSIEASHLKTEIKAPAREKPEVFHNGQYVMVTMKNGTEVAAIIHGCKSKKQYWVRKIGGKRQGLVHRRFLRPMTVAETAQIQKALGEVSPASTGAK